MLHICASAMNVLFLGLEDCYWMCNLDIQPWACVIKLITDKIYGHITVKIPVSVIQL